MDSVNSSLHDWYYFIHGTVYERQHQFHSYFAHFMPSCMLNIPSLYWAIRDSNNVERIAVILLFYRLSASYYLINLQE